MTTKKFIKEMMFFGISRNNARRLVKAARENGISNDDAHYAVCTFILTDMLVGMGMDIHVVPMEEHKNLPI